MRRIGIAGLWHETNTYSARIPGLAEFVDYELLHGEDISRRHRGTRSVIGGFLDSIGVSAVPLVSAGAWPAGPVTQATLGELVGRIGDAFHDAGPLDGVLLNLHGAMVADGDPDVESSLVDVIRESVGDAPIAAVLDLHGNPSPRLAANAEILVGYDTYPHVDMWESGQRAARLLQAATGGRRLLTAIAKLPLLTTPLSQGTSDRTMKTLLEWAKTRAEQEGMLDISLLPGFPYSDVERSGFSVLVVADETAGAAARSLADEVADRVALRAREGAFSITRPDPRTAVRQALQTDAVPVVLADLADNIGGGSPGDGTVILQELIAQGAHGAVVVLCDPEIARANATLSPGDAFDARVGGKMDHLHGPPVRIVGTVRRVTDGHYTTSGSWATGQSFCMGMTLVVDTGPLTIVLTERATPPFHAEQLTSVGIDPAAQRVLVAKGAVAWKAAFGQIARTVIEVDTPGACPLDAANLPRTTPAMTYKAAQL